MAKVIFNQLMEENGLVAQTNKLSDRKCCKVLLPPNLDKCHFSLFICHSSQECQFSPLDMIACTLSSRIKRVRSKTDPHSLVGSSLSPTRVLTHIVSYVD